MQCSCPDWAVPCKHLASVIYKVSSEIDNNPFLVFSLHNVELLKELEKFGIVIDKQNIEIPKIKDLYFDRTGEPREYNPENAYRKLSLAKLSSIHGALTALLSSYPAFYTASVVDFREKYLATLNRIVKNTSRAAIGKITLPGFFSGAYSEEQKIDRHSTNSIRLDESLHARFFINDKGYSVVEFFCSNYRRFRLQKRTITSLQRLRFILFCILQFSWLPMEQLCHKLFSCQTRSLQFAGFRQCSVKK